MTNSSSDRPSGRLALLLALLLSVALIATACSSDSDDAGGETTTTAAGTDEDAEGLPPCPEEEPPPVVEPVGSEAEGTLLSTVSVEPGPNSVLSAMVQAEAATDVTLDIVATSDGNTVEVPTTESSSSPEAAVLGMTAETDYDVAVTATSADGTTETVDLTFATGSLPADTPDVSTTVAEPDAVAAGFTLFNVRFWGGGQQATCEQAAPANSGWIMGLDETGELVWYYNTQFQVTDVSVTPRGSLLISINDVLIREIDMMGNTLNELGTLVATEYNPTNLRGEAYAGPETVPTEIDSAHHEVYEMDNGNILTLSTEVIELDPEAAEGFCDGAVDLDGNPVSDPTGVVADVVEEITRDGEVVQSWRIADYFEPLERPGAEMCIPANPIAPPNYFYPDEGDLRDWTHGNAAVVDEDTNTLMVSMRHLDSIIGIRYADDADGPAGELLWDLSPEGDLELTNGDYSYHGHAVEPQPDGTILYYDNGNGRPGAAGGEGDNPPYSRAVIYEIDAEAGTATQIWEHIDDGPFGTPQFAGFLGDADMLANGNVLITHGGVVAPDNVEAPGLNYSRIIEVTPDYDGGENTVVMDIEVGDRQTTGYTSYRAERIPSLYLQATT